MRRLRLLFGILSLLFLTIGGCFNFPEDVIAPEWDVDINVPLTNKTYTIYEMFKPQAKKGITSTVVSGDFYLFQSNNYAANSEVAEYIDFLDQGIASQNLIVPANAPAQTVFLVFPEEIEIDRASFASGYLSFAIQNPSAAAISSSLFVPGIKKPDGSELIIETNVEAFSSDSISYDLSDHQYIFPSNQPVQNKNSLQLLATANSEMNGSFESIDFYLYNLNYSSITGLLPKKSLGIKRTSISLELNDAEDFRDKLYIKEGTLNIRSEYVSAHQNNFEFEISNFNITGKRNTGEEKALIRNDGQNITFRLSNGVYAFSLDETNSNLADFISWLPDSIVVCPEYILNPSNDHTPGTITNLDSIKFSAQFSTKSIFTMRQTNYTDTLAIDLSQNDREKIRDGVGADLSIYLENAIPINAFVKATVTDENFSPFFILTKNQDGTDSLQFLGSQVNTNTGQIISPASTINTIQLNSAKIKMLSNARYIIISTTINTQYATNDNPNPPSVQFKSSDWLNLKCYGKIKYHVNPEGD